MKRLIILLAIITALLCFTGAGADPARTDGTVTAWIGEENAFFLKCSDGVTRKLSVPMKDILSMTETDVIGLTQNGRIVSVRKDGAGYSVLSENATETEIEEKTDRSFVLLEGRLSVGETVYSERAAAAATDGLVLYWVNKGENGYILMQKEMPGQEMNAVGRAPVSLTGKSVPEPIFLSVTGEALTLTAADRSIICFSLKTGESKPFPASGQMTCAACLADDRLYRYTAAEELPWVLENIRNDAMQLETVTPAPTPAPTPVPTAPPTAAPTAPRYTAPPPSGGGSGEYDGNIYKGARGRTVRKIQQRLWELGYPVGYVDGTYGEQTQIAVNLFYDAIHLREHNYVSPTMYNRLFAYSAPVYDPYMPLQKGDRGLSVLYMQMMLRKMGYDPGRTDGIYGEQTVKAVAEYQKATGYIPAYKEVPGEYASHELLEKLLGPETSPTPTVPPTATPAPTNAPTAAPTAPPGPTGAPTSTPAPTASPTAEPTATPSPTPSPATNTNL